MHVKCVLPLSKETPLITLMKKMNKISFQWKLLQSLCDSIQNFYFLIFSNSNIGGLLLENLYLFPMPLPLIGYKFPQVNEASCFWVIATSHSKGNIWAQEDICWWRSQYIPEHHFYESQFTQYRHLRWYCRDGSQHLHWSKNKVRLLLLSMDKVLQSLWLSVN